MLKITDDYVTFKNCTNNENEDNNIIIKVVNPSISAILLLLSVRGLVKNTKSKHSKTNNGK